MNFNDNSEENDEEENQNETFSLSCDTLNDNMSFAPLVEDISIFCEECKEFIYYGEIKMHRKLHKSFNILQINDFTGVNFKNLVKRRNKIVKYLKTFSTNDRDKILANVDEAYITIYNYLIIESHQEIQLNRLAIEDYIPHEYGLKNRIFNRTRTGSLVSEIATEFDISFGINPQSKVHEPSVVVNNISAHDECFATITGVDGHCANEFVSKNLILNLVEEFRSTQKDPLQVNTLSDAIERTLINLDTNLRTGLHDNVTYKSWSGCCLEMVVISKEAKGSYQLTAVNVGDGSIILVTKDGHQLLSTLHSMKNENEIKRIENLGGTNLEINGEPFLNGTTQITQLLGGYGNNKRKQCQAPSSKPCTLRLNLQNDLGLIILNREVTRLIPVEDVIEIFKSEITGSDHNLPGSTTETDIFDELINLEHLEPHSKISENNFKERKYLGIIEAKSRIIARKVINAGALVSNYNCDLSVVVFIFKESDTKR